MGSLGILIIGSLGLMTVTRIWRQFRSQALIFLLSMYVIVLGVSCIYYGTGCYNALRHGFHGISFRDCREFRSFYFCLQSVGKSTGLNYCPIDQDRRREIAKAGPNAQRLMDRMDHADFFKKVSRDAYGRYDLALGWNAFPLIYFGNDETILYTFSQYDLIEKEIRQAARMGTIKVRPIFPLPDCRLNLVIPLLPASFHSTLAEITYEPSPWPDGWNGEVRKYDDPRFTVALTRHNIGQGLSHWKIWRLIRSFYPPIYNIPVIVFLMMIIVAYWVRLLFLWRPTAKNAFALLAEQFFALIFFVTIFWYTLFDASGMPVLYRYMLYQNIMLPVLLVYYVRAFLRLRDTGTIPKTN